MFNDWVRSATTAHVRSNRLWERLAVILEKIVHSELRLTECWERELCFSRGLLNEGMMNKGRRLPSVWGMSEKVGEKKRLSL